MPPTFAQRGESVARAGRPSAPGLTHARPCRLLRLGRAPLHEPDREQDEERELEVLGLPVLHHAPPNSDDRTYGPGRSSGCHGSARRCRSRRVRDRLPTSAGRNRARKTIDMLSFRRNRRMLSRGRARSPSRRESADDQAQIDDEHRSHLSLQLASYGCDGAVGSQPAADTLQPSGPSSRKSVPSSASVVSALVTYTRVSRHGAAFGNSSDRMAAAHGFFSCFSSLEAVALLRAWHAVWPSGSSRAAWKRCDAAPASCSLRPSHSRREPAQARTRVRRLWVRRGDFVPGVRNWQTG